MDQRVRFVLEQESHEQTMTELCEIYDISRQTGYYWVQRYQQGGVEAEMKGVLMVTRAGLGMKAYQSICPLIFG